MKLCLSAFALSLLTAVAASANDPFHRSHEGGMSIYRGAQTLPVTLPYATYEAQERLLALQEQQVAAQSRFQAQQLNMLAERNAAQARYLRHLERRDTAWLRGNSVFYPRNYRNQVNLSVIQGARAPRNIRRLGHTGY